MPEPETALPGLPLAVAPMLAFLALGLLAALVGGVAAARQGAPRHRALSQGSGIFLGQLAVFLALVGLGLPPSHGQAVALLLGCAMVWTPG